MATEDVEGIRQRMVSLLVDSENLKRKVDRVVHSKKPPKADPMLALKQIADRIDQETRELYHLLPEHLRPDAMPRPLNPREPDHEETAKRPSHPPKPGGPIPREVRWPDWTIEKILALADEYKAKHGKWPNSNTGRVNDVSPDTWTGIDMALQRGNRGLPGGTTLARLLAQQRGVRTRVWVPLLNLEQILAWADEHRTLTQHWPTLYSGPVGGAPGEVWSGIDRALRRGYRGIQVKTSLARLLSERRGTPYYLKLQPLSEEQILAWADAHYTRTGQWPNKNSGAIAEVLSEDWTRINNSLIQGNRSLPGGSSLTQLLARNRKTRNRKALPHFDIEKLLVWADLHYARHNRWPTCWSGPIEDAPGETWNAADSAFKAGGRGLAESGYRSLAHLLDERRGRLQRRGNRPAVRALPSASAD